MFRAHALIIIRRSKLHYTASDIITPVGVMIFLHVACGSGSSVGIATDYRLDGPGLNPGGDEIGYQRLCNAILTSR